MQTKLTFRTSHTDVLKERQLAIIGQKTELLSLKPLLPSPLAEIWEALIEETAKGAELATTTTWNPQPDADPQRVLIGVLPEVCSHHNTPSRPDAVHDALKGFVQGNTGVWVALASPDHALASASAVARAFPLLSLKSPKEDDAPIHLQVALTHKGEAINQPLAFEAAHALREAAALVDLPPNHLTTSEFVLKAKALAEAVGAEIMVEEGISLSAKGFGGLWGVGKAAEHPPALVVLSHDGGGDHTTAWVAKGIVYDTGGLSIKGKTHMPGMKADMAAAAATLHAFGVAVSQGYKGKLYALLCLAENAVGPAALRPDDVITLYSGKRVEINNTDAEGRLVLGDGVAYATKHLNPDLVIDMATLTGAQLVATGKRHAGLMTNSPELEEKLIADGKASGNLLHPLPYAPEFFRSEFRSRVADLKNSVKDRMNAQSSCAGQFVGEHLVDYEGQWAHIDIAGPATAEERGTGFGVALLLQSLNL